MSLIKTNNATSTSMLDPGFDCMDCWTPSRFNAKEIAFPSNNASKGSNTWKSPTVHPAKLSLIVSWTVNWNSLNSVAPAVGIPTVPPTPIVNFWVSP